MTNLPRLLGWAAGALWLATAFAQPAVPQLGGHDFQPGSRVLFEDFQRGETIGEFPSRWKFLGSRTEMVMFEGEPVIAFLDGSPGKIVPQFAGSDGDYLPDEFTLEFEYYLGSDSPPYQRFLISLDRNQDEFWDSASAGDHTAWMQIGRYSEYLIAAGNYAMPENEVFTRRWHKVEMSFTRGKVKLYLDGQRLIHLPASRGNPQGLLFAVEGNYPEYVAYLRRVRLATGVAVAGGTTAGGQGAGGIRTPGQPLGQTPGIPAPQPRQVDAPVAPVVAPVQPGETADEPVMQDTALKDEFCFGATGQQCGSQAGDTAFCAQVPGCGGVCLVSGGSWGHDECCAAHPNGAGCAKPISNTGDGHCVAEWDTARKRTTAVLLGSQQRALFSMAGCGTGPLPVGGGWVRRVDFSKPNNTGTVNREDYCAPDGAVVHPEDGKYCCSGQSRRIFPMKVEINGYEVLSLRPNFTFDSGWLSRNVLAEDTRIPLAFPNPLADDGRFNVVLTKRGVEFDAPGVGTTLVTSDSFDAEMCVAGGAATVGTVVGLIGAPREFEIKLLIGAGKSLGELAVLLEERLRMSPTEVGLALVRHLNGDPAGVAAALAEAFRDRRIEDQLHTLREVFGNLSLKALAVIAKGTLGMTGSLDFARLAKDEYGASVTDILAAVRDAWGINLEQAARMLQTLGYGGREIVGALRQVMLADLASIGRVLRTLGFDQRAVADALLGAGGLSPGSAACILKDSGFDARATLDALVNNFQVALRGEALTPLLRGCGFDPRGIGSALKDGLGLVGYQVAQLLAGNGVSVRDVADVLYNSFNLQSAVPMAKELVLAGIGLPEIRTVLGQIWGLNGDAAVLDLARALNQTGLNPGDVVLRLKQALGISAETAGLVLKTLQVGFVDATNVLMRVYSLGLDAAQRILRVIFG